MRAPERFEIARCRRGIRISPEASKIITIERAFATALRKGDANAFRALADRAYGKPRQQLEHTAEAGGPLQHSIVVRFVKPGEDCNP
jgi:hypothetical protein